MFDDQCPMLYEKNSLVSPIVRTSSASTSTIKGKSWTTFPRSRHLRAGVPLISERIVSLSDFATFPIVSMSCSLVKLKMNTLSACRYGFLAGVGLVGDEGIEQADMTHPRASVVR